ncbi:MAG: CheR family methyltransferase [Planctomycetota bacterium]|jgi:chemotaxis protein methyltransferase CheR
MLEAGLITVGVISHDDSVVASARRRLDRSGFIVEVFTPTVGLPRTMEAPSVRVLILDYSTPGPLSSRLLDSFPHSPKTAHIPLLVLDPQNELDFHPTPFGSLRSLEDPKLLSRLREAAAASRKFVQGNAPTMEMLKLSAAAQQRFIEFVERRTGIVIEKGASSSAEEILRKRMFARKSLSVWEYLNILQFKDMQGEEFQRVLPAITVGETSFFRTQSHFTALKRLVIPDFLSRKDKSSSKLRAWSAGCASGEEAYSLAMTFHQEVGDLSEWDCQILATDISGVAVKRAREGNYSAKEVRRIPKQIKDRYFAKMGERYIIDRRIKDLVQFRSLNLNGWASAAGFEGVEPGMDLIFCENVIIYFSRPVIEQIIKRFYNVLAPGGYLFLGYSESLYKIQHAFQNISFQQTYFYRKDPEGAPIRRRRKSPIEGLKAPTLEAFPVKGIGSRPSLVVDETMERELPPRAPVDAPAEVEESADPAGEPDPVSVEDGRLSPALVPSFALIQQGRLHDAAYSLDDLLKTLSLDPDAHYLRGLTFEGLGDHEAAAREWRRALFLEPKHLGAHIRMGDQMARNGAAESALLHFRNALRALEDGTDPVVATPEGFLEGPALLDLCIATVKTLEAEEVA